MADITKQLEDAAQIVLVSIHLTVYQAEFLLDDRINKILMVIRNNSTIIQPGLQTF